MAAKCWACLEIFFFFLEIFIIRKYFFLCSKMSYISSITSCILCTPKHITYHIYMIAKFFVCIIMRRDV